MTQSYSQIKKQIEALQKQAEMLRANEVEGVVARIRVAIEHYGLSAEQLFGGGSGVRKKAGASASSRSMKYSDGKGNSWSGVGKRPYWLRDALNEGRALEEFLSAASPSVQRKSKAKASKKRASKVSYRDQTGNTWSGMGPRPRWLREALEAGKTLEQMTA